MLQDIYYLYLQKVCSGSRATSDRRNTNTNQEGNCRGWGEIRTSERDEILAGIHANEARRNRLEQRPSFIDSGWTDSGLGTTVCRACVLYREPTWHPEQNA